MTRPPTALSRSRQDPRAFADFYAEESDAVLVFFARRVWDAEVALDLCAETFALLYAGRRRFRGNTEEEARGYLYAIAHRQLARYLDRGRCERRAVRRLGIQVPAMEPDDFREVERQAGLPELRRLVADALQRLPAGQREAVRLRVIDGLPYAEVATRLAVSEPAARARVSRALRALAPALRPLAEALEEAG